MTCVSEHSLQMFVDNELDGAEAALVASHLRDCAPCSREIANVVRLKRATHQAGQRFKPSVAFQRKMMAQLEPSKPKRSWMRAAFAIPLSVALLMIALGLMVFERGRSMDVGRELADLHVSTMASANPVDVVSSDKHTVKPWFTGKVPFTFNVPELQGSQYELLGARMAYVAQAPAAQLIFKHGRHHCSVFILEDKDGLASKVRAPMNFTLINWRANGLAYFLVTDASPDTMQDLVRRIQDAARNT